MSPPSTAREDYLCYLGERGDPGGRSSGGARTLPTRHRLGLTPKTVNVHVFGFQHIWWQAPELNREYPGMNRTRSAIPPACYWLAYPGSDVELYAVELAYRPASLERRLLRFRFNLGGCHCADTSYA